MHLYILIFNVYVSHMKKIIVIVVLQVFDARKCSSSKDMFHDLCEHLQFATNGGNLRYITRSYILHLVI